MSMANPIRYANAFALSLCLFSFLILAANADAKWNARRYHATQNWINHGGDMYNRRFAANETKISPATASRLRLKWKFFVGHDTTATPAIFDGTLYFPSWNGNIYAVKASNGSLVWKRNLLELTGLNGTGFVPDVNWTVSRSTPVIAGELLIIGIYGPAIVIAVKRSTGKLVWSTQLDSHPRAVITMSGTSYKGGFYVGVSSLEESLSAEECCTFRGSFCKLDLKSGAILWQTFMLPDNHGQRQEYAGAAIWGSSPPIDIRRNVVYIATGNLYSAPLRVQQCQERENNQTVPSHSDECVEPDNHSDSVLALDLDSGDIRWYHQLGGYDVWFIACNNVSSADCPVGPGIDADFGEAPMMLTVYINGTKQDIVTASQKSGFVWALSRDDGRLLWSTLAGPGGVFGGATFGSATDGKRVYTNIANSAASTFILRPSNKTTTAGGWVALDAPKGEILWSTGNPSNASAFGPVSVANGVVFAASPHPTGPIYAMDARNGEVLWSYNTGATVYGGVSISHGCVYVGHGYRVFNLAPGNSLFAFCVL